MPDTPLTETQKALIKMKRHQYLTEMRTLLRTYEQNQETLKEQQALYTQLSAEVVSLQEERDRLLAELNRKKRS